MSTLVAIFSQMRRRQLVRSAQRLPVQLLLALLLAATATCAAGDASAGFSALDAVDWASLPLGSGGAAAGTNLTLGCACALGGIGTCTPRCCCDPGCPASATAAHVATGTCLQGSGMSAEPLSFCTSVAPLARVNLPGGDYYRLSAEAAAGDVLSQLLCIAADNNPSLGASYPGVCDNLHSFCVTHGHTQGHGLG